MEMRAFRPPHLLSPATRAHGGWICERAHTADLEGVEQNVSTSVLYK